MGVILQECPLSKYASIGGVGKFKKAAMPSFHPEKCHGLASKYEVSVGVRLRVPMQQHPPVPDL